MFVFLVLGMQIMKLFIVDPIDSQINGKHKFKL